MSERIELRGAAVPLVGDIAGAPGAIPGVLMHGAGQTRASWKTALEETARHNDA